MAKEENNSSTRNYQNTLLVLGILLTVLGIYQLPTIWTFKSSLMQIKGTLREADTYVTNVTDRRGHETRKAELIFYLNEKQQKYYFAKNIGNEWKDKKYETIVQGLKRADMITVWVKTNEVDNYEPTVFQIDNEKETLLDFETVRTEKSPLAAWMLLLGSGSLVAFLWIRFPGKFNKLFETNGKKN